ncbi:MAG: hypothetical protein CV087_19290 [Candidatus Brocadia sp. WS118]|nr:MAG: hypothetical protein CV087_19290 [Candidatus Brocadia sp. WS118]
MMEDSEQVGTMDSAQDGTMDSEQIPYEEEYVLVGMTSNNTGTLSFPLVGNLTKNMSLRRI